MNVGNVLQPSSYSGGVTITRLDGLLNEYNGCAIAIVFLCLGLLLVGFGGGQTLDITLAKHALGTDVSCVLV